MGYRWIEEVRSICGPSIPVLLVGCKADLRPSPNSPEFANFVSRQQAERVAGAIGARAYKECSALKIEGVDDVFEAATRASMLMREGVDGEKHHRRKSSGKSSAHEEEGAGKCCVSEKTDLKQATTIDVHGEKAAVTSSRQVDTGAELVAGTHGPLDPAEAARIRRKIDIHILPMMCILYWIQFMDKTTLGNAAILGIDLNIFVWGVSLCCHAACTSFGGLFVVRMLLGICEGSITAGFLIVSSMFYTRNEQTLRVGYWFLMNGTAQIISGFLSFGVLHIKTSGFKPWQWLFFPDSPTNAWFLTLDERAKAVQRIKVWHPGKFTPDGVLPSPQENQTGVENKHFKKEQFIEALTDPKTWLFALFAALDNIPNSLTNQRQIIVSSFGFTYLQTTLLGCVDGIIEIVTIFTGVTLAARYVNARAYIGAIYFIPNLVGVFLISLLPWGNKVGLLFGIWITGVPWIIIGVCYVACPVILLAIRYLLGKENKRRDAEPVDDAYDEVYIETTDPEGNKVEQKVPKVP
ncbi:hypothetical protein HWV62_41108 [Athelia sp. TMB]|nr:hypothetical protein HWV62_41108 [Athelia sp. TMB]